MQEDVIPFGAEYSQRRENTAEHTVDLPWIGAVLGGLLPTLMSAAVGILAGGVIFAVVLLGGRLFQRRAG